MKLLTIFLLGLFINLNAVAQQEIDSVKKMRQLQNTVIIKDTVENLGRYNNYGTLPERKVDIKQIKNANDLLDAVKFYVPGVFYLNHRLIYENAPIRVAVNGFIVNLSYLRGLSPDDVSEMSLISASNSKIPGRSSRPLLLIRTKDNHTVVDQIAPGVNTQ